MENHFLINTKREFFSLVTIDGRVTESEAPCEYLKNWFFCDVARLCTEREWTIELT